MSDIYIGNEVVRIVDGPNTSLIPVVAILNPATGLPAFPGGGGGGTADSTAANQVLEIAQLTAINSKLPAMIASRVQTDQLGQPGVARQQAVTTSPSTITLTTTVRRVSIVARTSNMRYVVGTGSVVASATTSHFIAVNERIDIGVPANGLIGVIRDSAATADGVLEVSELS